MFHDVCTAFGLLQFSHLRTSVLLVPSSALACIILNRVVGYLKKTQVEMIKMNSVSFRPKHLINYILVALFRIKLWS